MSGNDEAKDAAAARKRERQWRRRMGRGRISRGDKVIRTARKRAGGKRS